MKIYVLALSVLVLISCSGDEKSEAEIRSEFDQAVESSNWCELKEECTSFNPGCPLGCNVAVNKEKFDEISSLSKKLIRQYQSGGSACAYECVFLESIQCENNRCVANSEL